MLISAWVSINICICLLKAKMYLVPTPIQSFTAILLLNVSSTGLSARSSPNHLPNIPFLKSSQWYPGAQRRLQIPWLTFHAICQSQNIQSTLLFLCFLPVPKIFFSLLGKLFLSFISNSRAPSIPKTSLGKLSPER